MTEPASAVRRESEALRRPSEVLRRASEISQQRRESGASTTFESVGSAELRRKSSVFVSQGEWRPSDREAGSNGVSVVSSRRNSANSQVTISSRPQSVDQAGAEISFGNGEYANVVPRRTTPPPTGLRKPSIISSDGSSPSNPLSKIYLDTTSASPNSTNETNEIPNRRPSSSAPSPRDRNASAVSSLEDDSALSPKSLQLDRQISDNKATGLPNNDLPPLPPSPSDKTKRLSNLLNGSIRPKMASKLRSMVRRTSSDRISDKSSETLEMEEDETADAVNQIGNNGEIIGHYNEFENSLPLSPGRARIYTVEQARRGSFLPINRIKNEANGPRRSSVRLSEADVGFLLGKVSRISSDTLRQAATEGNTSLCEALVRGAVPIDEADIEGKTALMLAAEHGKGDTTEHLLSLGASVDLKEELGRTALYFAVQGSKLSCVRALISYGADGNIVVQGDTIFTIALLKVETSLAMLNEEERKSSYAQTSEVCRVMVKESKSDPIVRREKLKTPTLFLLDEWVRARGAGEELVVPPMNKLVEGEKTLINFLKQHRQRVNIITTIKIWFVVVFIGFDLATREMAMTPARILTYVFLYVGAYYL